MHIDFSRSQAMCNRSNASKKSLLHPRALGLQPIAQRRAPRVAGYNNTSINAAKVFSFQPRRKRQPHLD
jgi:hypothetical protein